MRARGVGVVAAALVLVLVSGGAGAAKTRTVRDVALAATGSLTYSWSGDPKHGCAAVGVCGVRGELILRPQASGQSAAPGLGPVMVLLDPSSATRVIREEGGAVVGECVDLPGSSFATLALNPSSRRATTATVLPAPSSGRCAGPTGHDLAGLSIPVRQTGPGLSFNLAGTRSFTAGPFSGTLVSTIRLTPAPSSLQGQGFSSSSNGPGRPVRPAQAPILEFLQLQYRVSAAPSSIQTQFRGTSDPSCQILDACGTSGSLAFSVQPSPTLTVIGSRVVPRRLSRRQVLEDMRRGKLRLSTFQLLAGAVSETFSRPDGSSCRDAVAMPALLLNTGSPQSPPPPRRTIPVTISANGGPGPDVFRTHCPGPDDSDLFAQPPNGGNQTYAEGSVTSDQLLAKRSVITLSEPGSFTGLGYLGSRSGSIVLDLTLTKVTAHTQR